MSNIWVPRVKILEPADPLMIKGLLAGEYTLRRRKADTGELIQQLGPFCNLITDAGLNRVGTAGAGAAVFVGTGSAAPATTDTQLQNFFAHTTSTSESWNGTLERGDVSTDYFVRGAGTWRFAAGTFSNTNLSEVGIGWFDPNVSNPTANHRCFSRALIVDGVGSPTTITLLSDEVLDVTYSLKHYPYVGSDVIQTVNISGTAHTFTTRSLGLLDATQHRLSIAVQRSLTAGGNFYTGTAAGTPPALAAVTATAMLTAGSTANVSATEDAYVNNSKTKTCAISMGLAVGNLTYGLRGLITHLRNSNAASSFINTSAQTTISPAIMKDNTKVFSMGWGVSWDRY